MSTSRNDICSSIQNNTNQNIFIFLVLILKCTCIELPFLVDMFLGKSSGLKNDWIEYKFVYACPCWPYVKEMMQICLYFEQAISNYLYTNTVIEQMYTTHTQHTMSHRQILQCIVIWCIHKHHKTHHAYNKSYFCLQFWTIKQ